MPPLTKQFVSIGVLCQQVNLLPQQLLALAEQLGIEPHEYQNGIPIFRGDAVEKIIRALRDAERSA